MKQRLLVNTSSFILVILSFTACAANNEVKSSDYSLYLENEYVQETVGRIKALLSQEEAGEEKEAEDLDAAISKIDPNFIDELDLAIERSSNIAMAVLKKDTADKKIKECNFFRLSVALDSMKESFLDMRNCKAGACNGKEISIILESIHYKLLRADELVSKCSWN